jgi:hypothetical protein
MSDSGDRSEGTPEPELEATAPQDSPSRAARLAVEGLVIMVSILVAFALESWGADRQIRSEVAEELAGIDRELETNIGLVAYQMDLMSRQLKASDTLVTMLAAANSPTLAVRDSIVWWVFEPSPTLNMRFGAIDALIASGRLPFVRSPELRLGLAALRGVVEDAVEEQIAANAIQEDRLLPMISNTADLSSLTPIGLDFFGAEDRIGRAVISNGEIEIPTRLELRNTIRRRGIYYFVSIAGMAGLLDRLEELRVLIREEVGLREPDPESSDR